MDEIKKFYFIPNVSMNDKTIGDLNLSNLFTQLISCSEYDKIKIWDMQTLECSREILSHTDVFRKLGKLSRNQVLSCSYDGSIKMWDLDTGLCIKTFYDNNPIACLR